MKYLALLMGHFLFSLCIPILPKNILFSIIRVYANIKFYFLNRKYQLTRGKQKYNSFMGQHVNSNNAFRLTEDRIAKMNRQAERSLRNIVMENRKQMKPAVTDMEQGLQILAEGQ